MDNELCELVTGHISKPKVAKEWIEELVYSPDHATLAVRSHDNRIDEGGNTRDLSLNNYIKQYAKERLDSI